MQTNIHYNFESSKQEVVRSRKVTGLGSSFATTPVFLT